MSRRVRPRKFRKLKSVGNDQYLVYRAPRSGKLVKYRSGRNLIFEVRSRKTGKLVGFLNEITRKGKKRSAKPRKFSRAQLSIKSRRSARNVISFDDLSFRINFKEYIFNQVKKRGRTAVKRIIEEIEINDEVLVGLDIRTSIKGEIFKSPYKMYGPKDADEDFLSMEIAIRIINELREEGIRTSPKAHSRRPDRKSRKWADITVLFGALS